MMASEIMPSSYECFLKYTSYLNKTLGRIQYYAGGI